jgi:hypothetical protein
MERKDSHPTREELLLAADGELSHRQAGEIERHLNACWECRSQMREIEETIEDYVRVYRRTLDPMLPHAAGPRALLKAQLHELASSRARGPLHWLDQAVRRRALIAVLAICAAVSIGLLTRRQRVGPREPILRTGFAPVTVPNSRLTPGVAASASEEEICRVDPPKNKVVPVSVERRVFEAYGIDQADTRAYEVDYLITPALGGSDDIRNLWPQSYSATTWNARVKDALEDRLRHLVCTGELDLATAQRDISKDWIAAYKHYFHANSPVRELAQ